MANIGLQEIYVDSIVVVCDEQSTCWAIFDPNQFFPILPSDTAEYEGSYFVCDQNEDLSGSTFRIHSEDSILFADYRPLYIADCLSVNENPPLSREFSLSSVYPNPFNASARIEFSLPRESNVTLSLYDILGREAATLIDNEPYSVGTHALEFNGTNLSSGVYLLRLDSDFGTRISKAVLLK
jgi:hypothetical protein